MKFKNVAIKSVAHIEPSITIESIDIGKRIEQNLKKFGLPIDIIQARTGIQSRRYWDEGVQPSDVATEAARLALEKAQLASSELDILINTSVCKDFIEPSVASLVHGNLNLSPDCINFDLGNACLGFIDAINLIGGMIDAGNINYGIIVNGESSRFVVENTIALLSKEDVDEQTFRENFATLTLGSGAAAMVLCRADLVETPHRIMGSVNLAATQHNRLCLGQRDQMLTHPQELMIAGIELAKQTLAKANRELGWSEKAFNHYVIHQISKRHTTKVADAVGFDLAKIYTIFQAYGNIGPASVPFVISKLLTENKLKHTERLGILGMGSGVNCCMMEILW